MSVSGHLVFSHGADRLGALGVDPSVPISCTFD